MVVSPWVVQGNLILAARRDRTAWLERRTEKAGKAQAARQKRVYGTYARMAVRFRKTAVEVQAITEEAWARKMRARVRADKARAQGYGHARGG